MHSYWMLVFLFLTYFTLYNRIFPTQRSNLGLPHCRQTLYQLSHKEVQEYWSGKPIPSPANLPDPGTKPGSPALKADFLPNELSGKPLSSSTSLQLTQINSFLWMINIPLYIYSITSLSIHLLMDV